jgi:hypothetical protein
VELQRRGLRVPFSASAEVAPENSPSAGISVSVVELSLRGCYAELSAPFDLQTELFVKIFKDDEYFEAKATVVHTKPASGMGLSFREVKPHFGDVLKGWIVAALVQQRRLEE